MRTYLISLLARTPVHVGAGYTDGIIYKPMRRERNTGFPIIPGSTIKGVFSRLWLDNKPNDHRVSRSDIGQILFGSLNEDDSIHGLLRFSEARTLAFPVRSARGCMAWVTCPLVLKRFLRDTELDDLLNKDDLVSNIFSKQLTDSNAVFMKNSALSIFSGNDCDVVLEEFCFRYLAELPVSLIALMQALFKGDPVWNDVGQRSVVLNDSMFGYFVKSGCDIIRKILVDDSLGVVRDNNSVLQENLPSETFLYSTMNVSDAPDSQHSLIGGKLPEELFIEKVNRKAFQFGADTTIGLGLCSVEVINISKLKELSYS